MSIHLRTQEKDGKFEAFSDTNVQPVPKLLSKIKEQPMKVLTKRLRYFVFHA